MRGLRLLLMIRIVGSYHVGRISVISRPLWRTSSSVLLSTNGGSENEVEVSDANTTPRRRLRIPKLTQHINQDPLPPSNKSKPKLTRITLGSEEDVQRVEMNDRLKNARQWDSQKLTDEEADMLNRALGIDAEILEGQSKSKSSLSKKKKSTTTFQTKEELIGDAVDVKTLKGFLELNPYICSGCGTNFQSKSPESPGFLPTEKLQQHRKNAERIREQQESIKILQLAGIEIGSDAAEEVLAGANVSSDIVHGLETLAGISEGDLISENSHVSEMTVDENYYETRKAHYASLQRNRGAVMTEAEAASDSVCVCQRCFRLQQYGQVEEQLRPGWSDNGLLTPERFQSLLASIKDNEAVVLCIVDIFDLRGSLLPNLREIAGNNPIVIAANKIDLLPRDASETRLTGWIHSEVKQFCGLVSPKDRQEKSSKEYYSRGWSAREKEGEYEGVLSRSAVHLVSCQTGHGMDKLMTDLMNLALDRGGKVYVMGAANVGKSSFINRLLSSSYQNKKSKSGKASVPLATVSNLPGTTLDFLKIRLPNGVTMIDTPGLINKGQLTSRLSTDELKQVIPVKPINAVTLRVSDGKCVLLGGLAKVELLDARPFFLTFFVSNEVKIHPTDSSKADEFIEKHIGELLFPPASIERLKSLGPFESKFFSVDGEGWKQSKYDIVIAGLGWISVTGSGTAQIKITVPSGTDVVIRPSLLPFEASHSTAKFTGGRLLKRSGKTSSNYGWRA